MKKLKLAIIAIFGIFTVTAQNGCTKDSLGLYNETEYVMMNARKAFDLTRSGDAIQQGQGFVFKSPVYQTGGEAQRFAIGPNTNAPQFVDMSVLTKVEGYNNQGQPAIRTFVDVISCKIVRGPENHWQFWNNRPGFEYFGTFYYQKPLEFSITYEFVPGYGDMWTVKLN